MFLVVGLLLGLSLLVRGLLRRRRPTPPEAPRCTWQVSLPRDAHFPAERAQAWFLSLLPLLTPTGPAPTVELLGVDRQVELRVTAPIAWESALAGQLAAWFPGSRLVPLTEPVKERVSLPLALQASEVLPIRIGVEGSDPLLGVVGAVTQDDLVSGLSLFCEPERSDWDAWAQVALESLAQGVTPALRGWPFALARLLRLVRGRPAGPAASAGPSPKLDAARAKVADRCVRASVSVFAEGEPDRAASRCRELAASIQAGFRHPFGNTLAANGEVVSKGSRTRVPCTLSLAEMAALFHLPETAHPLVQAEPLRRVPPTSAFVRSLVAETEPITGLGEALGVDAPLPFGLTAADRLFHTYVVGKTGTGKSTLLSHVLRQDLEAGHGVGLIDPHGDLAEQVLALVPRERYDEVLYFNPADAEYPVAFNLLAATTPEQRPLVASGVVGVFKKLYGDSWGPRLEYFLRNSVLALLETPSPSLLSLPRLLNDRTYRERLLDHVRDPLLRTFFLEEFPRYDPRWRAEAISPILNKVGQFLSSPLVRHIVGQNTSGFDLRTLMDDGGIFIANLASGRIGEDNAGLLGGLLVAGFQLAAMSRADLPEAERRDFYLCVDEFQHFAHEAFAVILSEARKYRLSLTLSHQYLDQLPPGISEAVFGNVGSLCAFRVGAADTTRLAREFAPAFDAQDLIHLPNHHFCARVARSGLVAPPFSCRTERPPLGPPVPDPMLTEGSRRRWARRRADVELEVADQWEGL